MPKIIVGLVAAIFATLLICVPAIAADVEPRNCATYTTQTTQRCPTGSTGPSFTVRGCASCNFGVTLRPTAVNTPCYKNGVQQVISVQGCMLDFDDGLIIEPVEPGLSAYNCGGTIKFQDGVNIASGTIRDTSGNTRGSISDGSFTLDCSETMEKEIFMISIPSYNLDIRIIVVSDAAYIPDGLNDIEQSLMFVASKSMEITVCIQNSSATVPGYVCSAGIMTKCPDPDFDVDITSDWGARNLLDQCYAPARQSVTDDSGTWEYSQNCSYNGNAV